MNIKWYKVRSNLSAKINKNNIILNSSCTKVIDSYAFCRLGFNPAEKRVYINPVSYDEVDYNRDDATLFKICNTRTYSRISCTDFISEVSSATNMIFNGEEKFDVSWDDSKQLLTISLKDEVIRND